MEPNHPLRLPMHPTPAPFHAPPVLATQPAQLSFTSCCCREYHGRVVCLLCCEVVVPTDAHRHFTSRHFSTQQKRAETVQLIKHVLVMRNESVAQVNASLASMQPLNAANDTHLRRPTNAAQLVSLLAQ